MRSMVLTLMATLLIIIITRVYIYPHRHTYIHTYMCTICQLVCWPYIGEPANGSKHPPHTQYAVNSPPNKTTWRGLGTA